MAFENVTTEVNKHVDEDERIRVIGATIRAKRRALGLSLRDVSQKSGLSISFLSQAERGMSSLALTSLSNVARALDIDLASLFPNADEQSSARTEESKQEPQELVYVRRANDGGDQITIISSQWIYHLLSPRLPGLKLEPMLVTIQPGEMKDKPNHREGEEFIYILSGRLVYLVNHTEYHLGPGDSIHLSSSMLQSTRNDTNEPAQVLWVLTPRLF